MAEKTKLSQEDADALLKKWTQAFEDRNDPGVKKALKEQGFTEQDYVNGVLAAYRDTLSKSELPEDRNVLDRLGAFGLGLMDYGSGYIRTPFMQIAASLSGPRGREEVKKNFRQDWLDTIRPFDERPAPTGEEWVNDRMAVPRELGGKVLETHLPGMGRNASLWGLWNFASVMKHKPYPEAPGPSWGSLLGFAPDVALAPSALKMAGGAAQKMAATDIAKKVPGLAASLEFGGRVTGMPQVDPYDGMSASEVRAAIDEANKTANRAPTLKQKILKFVNPMTNPLADPGEMLKKTGDSLYGSSFRAADQAAKDAGQGSVSELAKENGIWGSPRTRYDQTRQLSKDWGEGVTTILSELKKNDDALRAQAGLPPRVMTRKDLRAPVTQSLLDRGDFAGDKANQYLKGKFNRGWGNQNDFDMLELNDIKKDHQDIARKSGAYSPNPTYPINPTRGVEIRQEGEALGQGAAKQAGIAQRGVEDMVEGIGKDQNKPGLGGEIYQENRDIATLMAGLPQMRKQMNASPWSGSWYGGLLRDAKEAGQTGLGLGLSNLGRPVGTVGRAALLHSTGKRVRQMSPWHLLETKMEENDQ